MKFRTDFVTNSSSNSYCVSLRVDTAKGPVHFNLLPSFVNPNDGYVEISLESDIDNIVARIKACKTALELTQLLVDEYSQDENEWNEQAITEMREATETFEENMSRVESITEINSVTFFENYSGWGEEVQDVIEGFLGNLIPDPDEFENPDVIRECLQGKLTEQEIEEVITYFEDYKTGFITEGNIKTTVILDDGTVEKEYHISI